MWRHPKTVPGLIFLGALGLFGGGCSEITATNTCGMSNTSLQSGMELDVGHQGVYGGDEIAQSFIPTATATVSAVNVSIKKVGSPAGYLKVFLVADNAGQPAAVSSTYSGQVLSSLIGTSDFVTYTFTLGTAFAVTSGSTYWIRVLAPTIDASNYFRWGASDANPLSNTSIVAMYETGVADTFSNGSIGINRDMVFSLRCN